MDGQSIVDPFRDTTVDAHKLQQLGLFYGQELGSYTHVVREI